MTAGGAQDPSGPPVSERFLSRVVRTTGPTEQASGFVIEVDGEPFLLTAAGVVGKGARRLLVMFERANRMLEVALLGTAGGGRVAVCWIASANFIPPCDISAADRAPRVLEPVFSVGFLRGVRGLATAGDAPFVLSASVAAVPGEGEPVFYLDGSFNPGMVGGPVLRADLGDDPPVVLGVTLGRQPIETKGATGILSPGEDRDPAVDTNVVAVLGIRSIVDLIRSGAPRGMPS